MFNGIRFAKEVIRSRRDPVDNVCIGATATCGPAGHPCEPCMHLKGEERMDRMRDLCLIAPRSLARPVRYKRYFNRGMAAPPFLPVSKVAGELKEVSVADMASVDELGLSPCRPMDPNFNHQGDEVDNSSLYRVTKNVYIEHNGLFTKAPQHLLKYGDYTTRTCYLEDTGGPEFNTALDMAIFAQTLWSYFAKAAMGLLSGVALIEMCLVMQLVPVIEGSLVDFFNTYSYVCTTFFSFVSVGMIIALVALFDWMDLAHMNLQHIWDTYLHRTIWIVTLPFLIAFVLHRYNAEMNDALFLQGNELSQYTLAGDDRAFYTAELWTNLHTWKNRLLTQNGLLVCGWILLVITRNDDLLLLHLESMKKYDRRA